MGASSRTIEVTVISGENVHVKEEAYVVVRAESLKSCTTKMAKDTNTASGCTKDDNKSSSSFLSWNEKLLLDMPLHARSITFEVQCKNSKGARPVGVARIAVSEILGYGGDVHDENCLHVLSYRLRDWEGRRNGIIHFAVRVAAEPEENLVKPAKGLAENHKTMKNSSEVVLGVPLWWSYPNII